MADETLELTEDQQNLLDGGNSDGKLPSDQGNEEEVDKVDPWKLSNEFLDEEGKALKRFKNADELAKAYQNLERKMSDDANARHNEKQQQEEAQTRESIISESIKEFGETGVITDEMKEKLAKVGISEEKIELETIKAKDRISKAHNVVGGADEYNAMIAWGRENMTPEQQAAFDSDVVGGLSEYAIKGLHSDFLAATGNSVRADRIRGTGTPTGEKGYTSMKEMQDDIAYIRKNPHDIAAQKRYNAKVSLTNQATLIG